MNNFNQTAQATSFDGTAPDTQSPSEDQVMSYSENSEKYTQYLLSMFSESYVDIILNRGLLKSDQAYMEEREIESLKQKFADAWQSHRKANPEQPKTLNELEQRKPLDLQFIESLRLMQSESMYAYDSEWLTDLVGKYSSLVEACHNQMTKWIEYCEREAEDSRIFTPEELREKKIAELNKTHFISMEAGRTSVYVEAWDARSGKNVLHRSSFRDFQDYFLNIPVFSHDNKHGESVYRPLGEVYLKSPKRRQYAGITLDPGKEDDGIFYNLWRGFSVPAAAGSWRRMRHHIFSVICGENEKLYRYVMGWLATTVQSPGERAEVAVVLRGKRGTGKGMLGNYLCKLFGANAAHITSSKYLTGNFNSHLRDVVFLFADEAFWAGDKQGESVLKGIVTEPTLTIEGKGRDVIFVKNMLHILMASNNDWVVPAGLEERRFCVLDVCDSRMQDKTYFAGIVDEMENGGLSAMLYDLQNYDLSAFDVREVPQTYGLFEQKLQSLDTVSQWWFHRLSEGELIPGYGWGLITTEKLHTSYLDTLARRGINYRTDSTQFGIALRKMVPKGWELRKYRYPEGDGVRQVYHYSFPGLDVCRECFSQIINYKVEW